MSKKQPIELNNRQRLALSECCEYARRRAMMGAWRMVSMAQLQEYGLVAPHYSRTGLIDGWLPTKEGVAFKPEA